MSGIADSATRLVAPPLAHPGKVHGCDEELVARAQAGDEAALQELYRRHVGGVFRRITNLVGPEPDREDLVQQVFIELFRGLHRFRGDARFSTYLYRIATNVAYDQLKRRRRRHYSCDDLEQRPCPCPSPETVTMRLEQLHRAWRYLDRIKPKKRVAFLLRVVEGLTLEEIAEQVGARAPAVAQRILHAQRELLALMQKGDRV